jgi:Putative DNA-binding domain
MAMLLEYQTQLADALLRGDLVTTSSLFAGSDERRHLGLRVYANNRMHALVSALRDTFPAVRAVVGEGAFTAIGVDYARNYPMARGDLLMWYGAAFPAYLQRVDIEGAARLADLARLEYAWLEAYHAPDAVPLAPAAMAELSPEQLIGARLRVHPSLRLLHLTHDVEPLWRQFGSGTGEVATTDRHDRPALLAILRPAAEVVVLPVSAPVFACIALLRDGAMFGDASDDLNEAGHLTEFQALIATGLFTGIETET